MSFSRGCLCHLVEQEISGEPEGDSQLSNIKFIMQIFGEKELVKLKLWNPYTICIYEISKKFLGIQHPISKIDFSIRVFTSRVEQLIRAL